MKLFKNHLDMHKLANACIPEIVLSVSVSGYDELTDIPCEYHDMQEVLFENNELEFWSDAYVMAYGNTLHPTVEDWVGYLYSALDTIRKDWKTIKEDTNEDEVLAEFIHVDRTGKCYVRIHIAIRE